MTRPAPDREPLSLTAVEALAREAHATQTDKAGRPYAEHLQAVAEGVRARGGDDEQPGAGRGCTTPSRTPRSRRSGCGTPR